MPFATIIHAKNDIDAYDIAYKVHLSLECLEKKDYFVYVVPKYSRINSVSWLNALVFSKIQKAKYVIFICTKSNVILDKNTKKELQFALKNKKSIYLIIPNEIKNKLGRKLLTKSRIIDYNNEKDLIKKIINFDTKNKTLLGIIYLLVGLMALRSELLRKVKQPK